MKIIKIIIFFFSFVFTLNSWADSSNVPSIMPSKQPIAEPKLIWYQPELVFNGNEQRQFTMDRACPPNKGNVFCSIARMDDTGACAITAINIGSWIDKYDPRKVIVEPNVKRNWCKQGSSRIVVSCAVICIT